MDSSGMYGQTRTESGGLEPPPPSVAFIVVRIVEPAEGTHECSTIKAIDLMRQILVTAQQVLYYPFRPQQLNISADINYIVHKGYV
jgi:hypothetical protein